MGPAGGIHAGRNDCWLLMRLKAMRANFLASATLAAVFGMPLSSLAL